MGWFKKTEKEKRIDEIYERLSHLKNRIEDYSDMQGYIISKHNQVEYDNKIHLIKYDGIWLPVDGKYLCDVLDYSAGTCKGMVIQFKNEIDKLKRELKTLEEEK